MSPPTAFVLSTPFLGSKPSPLRPFVGARSPIRPGNVTTAVLGTPAGNTYLQRHAEVVLRDFLTRRAVNTVMYYMLELGDGPGCNWLKKFDEFEKKVSEDKFSDGEGYLDKMLHARREKGTLKISHPKGYFSRTYTFTIEPNRIAQKIFAARQQLAEEWAHDLKCIRNENLEIQRMAFEKMLCKDERKLQSKRNLIFDTDPFSNENSPLRYKNYMSLKTLLTQHAAARLLPFMRDEGSNHEYMYLLQFVKSYGPINDGDAFVQDLMNKPIEMRTNPSHTVQPRAIALQVLEIREAISEEWISTMEYIPEEQMMMNRRLLERSMDMSNQLGEDIRKPKRSSDTSGTPLDMDGDDTDTKA